MTPITANLVTYHAILHWPALPGPPATSLLRRIKADIADLQSLPAAPHGTLSIACSIAASRPPAFEVAVSADTPDLALEELARLTLALVRKHRVARIAWLDQTAVLERGTFLRALDPAPSRPKRPSAKAPALRKAQRMSPAQSQRVLENVLRMDNCGPVDRAETVRMRQMLPAPQRDVAGRWVAVGSMVATAAILAANAGAAAAQAMSSGGLF